jgi:hypothetical protein
MLFGLNKCETLAAGSSHDYIVKMSNFSHYLEPADHQKVAQCMVAMWFFVTAFDLLTSFTQLGDISARGQRSSRWSNLISQVSLLFLRNQNQGTCKNIY